MQVLFCLHGYIQIFHWLFITVGDQRRLHMSSAKCLISSVQLCGEREPNLSDDDSVNVIWNGKELVVSLLTLGQNWIGNHASVVLRCDNRYRGNTIVQVYLLWLIIEDMEMVPVVANNWRYGNGPWFFTPRIQDGFPRKSLLLGMLLWVIAGLNTSCTGKCKC